MYPYPLLRLGIGIAAIAALATRLTGRSSVLAEVPLGLKIGSFFEEQRRRLRERFGREEPEQPQPSPEAVFLEKVRGSDLEKRQKRKVERVLEEQGLAKAEELFSRMAAGLRI